MSKKNTLHLTNFWPFIAVKLILILSGVNLLAICFTQGVVLAVLVFVVVVLVLIVVVLVLVGVVDVADGAVNLVVGCLLDCVVGSIVIIETTVV